MTQDNVSDTGNIYIMFNEVFNHYGENVFKLGKSKDVIQRMNSYSTSYIKPVELKFVSESCHNHSIAEKMIFLKLDKYRIVKNREFFKVEIDVAIDVIESIVKDINNEVVNELYNEHLASKLMKQEQRDIKTKQSQDKTNYVTNKNIKELKPVFIQELKLKFGSDGNDMEKRMNKHKLLEIIENIKHDNILLKLLPSNQYQNQEIHKLLFEETSVKARLGFFNKLLKEINMKITTHRKQEIKGNKTSYYKLESLETNS